MKSAFNVFEKFITNCIINAQKVLNTYENVVSFRYLKSQFFNLLDV